MPGCSTMTACVFTPPETTYMREPCNTPAEWVSWARDLPSPVPPQCLRPLCQAHAEKVANLPDRVVQLLDEVA
jgi:hypothetical protein